VDKLCKIIRKKKYVNKKIGFPKKISYITKKTIYIFINATKSI